MEVRNVPEASSKVSQCILWQEGECDAKQSLLSEGYALVLCPYLPIIDHGFKGVVSANVPTIHQCKLPLLATSPFSTLTTKQTPNCSDEVSGSHNISFFHLRVQ